jgi:hypothetical protein
MLLEQTYSDVAENTHETNNKTKGVNSRRVSKTNQLIQVFLVPFNLLQEVWLVPPRCTKIVQKEAKIRQCSQDTLPRLSMA